MSVCVLGARLHAKGADFSPSLLIIYCNNLEMDLQEVGGNSGDWMELAQDRDRWRPLVNTVMNLRVPKMRGIS